MLPVHLPATAGLKVLAGRDRCRIADHLDQIAMAADLHAEHSIAVVRIVVGHSLDGTGERFAVE